VNIMFDNVPSAAPLVESGRAMALAVTGIKRSPLVPYVMTVDELAVPGFDSSSWIALYAPAGTPEPIVTALNKAANVALKDERVLKTFAQSGLSPQGGSPKDLADYQANEIDKWAKVVKAIGYEPK